MKTVLTDIRVGDHVRDRFGVLSLVAAINDEEIRYSDVEHGQTFSTVPRSMTPELVARAVYLDEADLVAIEYARNHVWDCEATASPGDDATHATRLGNILSRAGIR